MKQATKRIPRTYMEKIEARLEEIETEQGFPHDFLPFCFWSSIGVEIAIKAGAHTSALHRIDHFCHPALIKRKRGTKNLYLWLLTDNAVEAMRQALAHRDMKLETMRQQREATKRD